jgi:hypothetical protein
MNPKEFTKKPDQVGAERGKRATGRMSNLPQEAQAPNGDSPAGWALWRLSLVLKEISGNLELPDSNEKPEM